MLKTVALESETGPQIPPQCGQVVLACAQTTMRGVANIWAAAQHKLFLQQFKLKLLTYFQPTSAFSLLLELKVTQKVKERLSYSTMSIFSN